MNTERKIPLPNFLKLLTSNDVSTPKAMAVAGKIYKEFNTPSSLSQLTDIKLAGAGINDKDLRKSALAAFRKAGYKPPRKVPDSKNPKHESSQPITSSGPQPGPSTPSALQILTTPTKKRKRDGDMNEFLPDVPTDEAAKYGSMAFNEILDQEVLRTKWTIVNRAPLMTAWATVVAERMGFEREEALSIASVYTEMNAISKGISLGIYEASKNRGLEATKSGSQPYVDIMGRRVALYKTQAGHWRALANNSPAKPSSAFSYISRSFRQTTPHVMGALRLLANSYDPQQLNKNGFSLYAEFRPTVGEWGGRGELRCEKILALRRKTGRQEAVANRAAKIGEYEAISQTFVKVENVEGGPSRSAEFGWNEDEPDTKRTRGLSLEEYEAALDQDISLCDADLDFYEKEDSGD